MFHLFKRVYLAFDSIDPGDTKVGIVSARISGAASVAARRGALLFYSTDPEALLKTEARFKDFSELFHWLCCLEEKVLILCDPRSLAWLMKAWLVTLLGPPDGDRHHALYCSYVHRYRLFFRNFLSSPAAHAADFDPVCAQEFVALPVPQLAPWPLTSARHVGVEFLLATHLLNGSLTEDLKYSILPLLRKDLEKYLFELKEILLVHVLHRPFMNQFGLTREYSIFNWRQLLSEEQHPSIRVFFDPAIWVTEGMAKQSSRRNIRLENIGLEQIAALKQFNELAGGRWEEEKVYQFVKSDVTKLDFLPLITEFSDAGLKRMLEVETGFQNAAGSFFSIDLVTVNHYLVNHCLNASASGNTDELTWLAIRQPTQGAGAR